jgi:lysophospholipase L1-like esterase
MKTVLCYGDSNTWGAAPMQNWIDQRRLDPAIRWPSVMQRTLGADWQVVAEGLPGRTTVHPDPVEGGHLSGLASLRACLESHKPLSLVILMLGTNDFKRRFSLEAEDVALGVKRLIGEIRQYDVFGRRPPRILLIAPPAIEVTGIFTTMYIGADIKSRTLAPLLRQVADDAGAEFLDAGAIVRPSPIDGIHFDAAAHEALGRAVAATVMESERVGASR